MRGLALALLLIAMCAFGQTRTGLVASAANAPAFGSPTCAGACGAVVTTTASGSTATSTSATTSTITGTSTTTIAGTPLPSWVNSMLAAWMLDETSGTRVNLQGTTSRDLSVSDGADLGSSTDRVEGTRSASVVTPQAKHTTDNFSALTAPLSLGCWSKSAAQDVIIAMRDFSLSAGTFQLGRTASGGFRFLAYDSTNTLHTATSPNTWSGTTWEHIVGTMTSGGSLLLYVEGIQQGSTPMGTSSAKGASFYLGDNFAYTGSLDECFITDRVLSPAAICRICSCGLRGELCGCSGTAFASTGRNGPNCNSCTLPSDCGATTPP